jgi:methionyl-tRNA formyltransferase
MARLRVALFGSGSPMSVAALHVARDCAELTRVILPQRRRSPRALLSRIIGRAANPLVIAAHEFGIPISDWDDAIADVSRDQPDLVCVATFPRILPQALLSMARIGALNIHGSVLPRHRGPDPLFWTYFHGDQETGVTLHWMNAQVDAGNIVAQRRWILDPAVRAQAAYMRQVDEARTMLAGEITKLGRGEPPVGMPQDPSAATHDPSPRRRTWSIDFDRWEVERVWHFVWGLAPVHNDLLTLRGKPLSIFPALQLSKRQHDRPPGTLLIDRGSFQLFCRGGVIEGQVLPASLTWRRAARQWLEG